MKHVIVLFAAIVFLCPNSCGQELSLASVPDQPRFETYSVSNFANNGKQRKMCVVTKAGFVTMGGGLILMGAGFNLVLGNSDPSNVGLPLLVGGVVIVCAGAALTIGGAIHDISNRHKQRLGIIAPRRNQLGIAYNF